mmetsp:Transcript_5982/g.11759  ORF Transcript_5982/g.11759 Transcript_5982/m.11759 type:complete len:310 (+) Transcript_5982:152-1081(+)
MDPHGLYLMDSQVVVSPCVVGMKKMETLNVCLWNKRGDSSEGNGSSINGDYEDSFTRSSKRQKLDHSSSSESLGSTSSSFSSAASTTHQPSNKPRKQRRRVQIQEDQTTEHHPPSEHSSVLDENPNLWYTKEDFTLTLQSMKNAIQSLKERSDDCSLPIYGETLASTYLACCVDSNSSVSSCIPTTITPMQLEMLSIGRGDHRGMETCALPDLAAERSQKRREIIQNVVFLNRTLSGVTERDEFVRSVSEQLTAPSRKFAQAMGISDTLSALATYAEEGSSNATSMSTPSQQHHRTATNNVLSARARSA